MACFNSAVGLQPKIQNGWKKYQQGNGCCVVDQSVLRTSPYMVERVRVPILLGQSFLFFVLCVVRICDIMYVLVPFFVLCVCVFFLSQVSYTVMLKGYGRTGDIGAAELMFELMANDPDQRPDVVALNSLLDACVRNGDLRRAVEVLEQVRNIQRADWLVDCVCWLVRLVG